MIGRRRNAVALLLGVAATALLVTSAYTSNTKWVRKQIGWTGPGAAGTLAGGGFDSVFVAGAADTQRTVTFPASQVVDWEELGRQVGLSNGVSNAFLIEVTAHKWNGASDTLYARMEFCGGDGGCNVVAGSAASSTTNYLPLLLQTGAAFADSAVGSSRATTVRYAGYISADADATPIGTTVWMQDFRLKICGDVSGTTPKLSGCRAWITYPQRAQP